MSNIMDFLKNIFGGSSGGANNFDRLVAAFEGQDDFLQRTVKSGENEFVVLFLDCMSDAANVGRFVLEPLTSAEKKLESAQEVADRAVSSIGAELVGDFETMQSKLLNRIPLLKHLKWREVIGFKTLYGTLTDKNNPFKQGSQSDLFEFPSRNGQPTSFVMGDTPYMELNVGIHNIFKILRVDYVRRLNYLNAPNAKKNGVRFVLQFDF